MRTFEYSDSKSSKFWNIDLSGTQFTVTYGKVGSKGQTKTKEFDTEEQAEKEHDKLVADKLRKGYTETTAAPASAPFESPLLKALEDDLAENPDDLATHSARADYLIEQGDPRGEFAQVQLALEDDSLPADEVTRLRRRAEKLQKDHERQWLGDLGHFLIGSWNGDAYPWQHHFRRGWLDSLRLSPFPEASLEVMAKSPATRLLSRLEIVYDMSYHWEDFDPFMQEMAKSVAESGMELDGELDALLDGEGMFEEVEVMEIILESPYLRNLQAFKIGFSDDEDRLAHSTMIGAFRHCTLDDILALLEKNPRLTELYLNTDCGNEDALFASPLLAQLRVFQYFYGSPYNRGYQHRGSEYPLAVLAQNEHVCNLTSLRLHPGRDGSIDIDRLDALLQSPHFTNLTHLQIHMSTFGDDGARRIVGSGILKRLKVLDIGYGDLTDEGARVLANCPDLKHLVTLGVKRNRLTDDGIARLQAAGVTVVATEQYIDEDSDDYWAFDVDYE